MAKRWTDDSNPMEGSGVHEVVGAITAVGGGDREQRWQTHPAGLASVGPKAKPCEDWAEGTPSAEAQTGGENSRKLLQMRREFVGDRGNSEGTVEGSGREVQLGEGESTWGDSGPR